MRKVDQETGETYLAEFARPLDGLLQHLRGYAVGQARRGSQARRTHREPDTLNGDDTLASHIDVLPEGDDTDLTAARQRREQIALNRALAAGGVNTAASELLAEMHYSLSSWAKGIAKDHNLPLEWKTTSGYASFLACNVPKIALDPDAGRFARLVHSFIRRAEKIINPPIPPRECGPCPTVIVETKGRRKCATVLTADRGAIEVTCPSCDTTHRVEKLLQDLWNDVDEWHLTRSEILELLKVLGDPIPAGTFDSWRSRGTKTLGRLLPRGWRRPGEKAGEWHETRQSSADRPVFRLIDIRKFMTDKKTKTTATA